MGTTAVEVGLLRRAFGGRKGLSLRHLHQTVLAHAVAIDCVCRMPRWRVCACVRRARGSSRSDSHPVRRRRRRRHCPR